MDIADNELINDDCLLEIFRYLNLKDLTCAVRVSKQFQRIARDAFRIKYRRITINENSHRLDTERLSHIFQDFGHLMEKLIVSTESYKKNHHINWKTLHSGQQPIKNIEVDIF